MSCVENKTISWRKKHGMPAKMYIFTNFRPEIVIHSIDSNKRWRQIQFRDYYIWNSMNNGTNLPSIIHKDGKSLYINKRGRARGNPNNHKK